MDDGGAHRGTVYARIGTDFHIVLNNDDTDLGNLVIAFGGGGKPESVRTDDTSGMQDAIVSHPAILINRDMGIERCVISYFGMASYGRMRVDASVVAYLHTFFDAGKGTDIDIFPDFSGRSNGCQRVDARLFRLALFV